MVSVMINTDGGSLKVLIAACINIYKLLRIPVNQGEPTALHLDHYAVPLFKGVSNIIHGEFYFRNLTGRKRFRVFKIVPVPATHYISAHQHLVSIHEMVRSALGHSIFILKMVG